MSMEAEIMHLVGYITPKQWADAIRQARDGRFSERILWELMAEVEERWGGGIKEDVQHMLGDITDEV